MSENSGPSELFTQLSTLPHWPSMAHRKSALLMAARAAVSSHPLFSNSAALADLEKKPVLGGMSTLKMASLVSGCNRQAQGQPVVEERYVTAKFQLGGFLRLDVLVPQGSLGEHALVTPID